MNKKTKKKNEQVRIDALCIAPDDSLGRIIFRETCNASSSQGVAPRMSIPLSKIRPGYD